ncbi:MAG: nucleotide sugar dehydrogenase [Anaerolineales bacterium]|nr:nucleotide sugar dehydrogenase [Anaerolineales bacterium]NUQ84645.1 nucleotide sugar dehydrogenase [Anaerolineales bacterium]
MNFDKICVLGLGYIGLPTASMFAARGVKVVGVDINLRVVETLRKGELHIHEPGLRNLVEDALRSGNLTVSSQPEEADVFLIAVPTPFHEDEFAEYEGRKYKLADMSAVISATEAILPHLRKGNLVVLESTSPPRATLDLVRPILERSNLKAGTDFLLCYSPERVLPGQILRELIENARVVGGVTPESAKAARDLYSIFVKGEIIETDATTAEMVKLMENTTRDINIAIANEFSRLAEKFGVDVWEAIRLANLHPRINILSPGPGVGGHCISVDPWFLVETAPELTSLIYHARKVNDEQPRFVVEKVKQAFNASSEAERRGDAGSREILKGKTVAALGLAYKPDVDDLRESPAVEVVHLLQNEGVQVKAWEPFKPEASLKGVKMSPSLEEAVKDADAILLLVKHAQFIEIRPGDLASKTSARIAVDCVNAWKAEEWQKAGFQFHRLGDNKSPNL